jgi:hypothetical protein
MTSWAALNHELDRWSALGQAAEFWWRDDDATHPTPALERLLSALRRHHVAAAIAVIPARATTELADRLAQTPEATVIQHGWSHANHAPLGQSKAELGPHRPTALMLGELARGALTLERLFGDAWLRVLVPPHNRIAAMLASALAQAGYIGLSRDKPRRETAAGLIEVNTHVDIMNWQERRFLGTEACLDLTIRHLASKRAGEADPSEPTGLLTHHLAHDEDAWRFIDQFVAAIAAHAAARWRTSRAVFGATPPGVSAQRGAA